MIWLSSLARAIEAVNEWIGRAVAWSALAMVLVQFAVVVLRYVFGVGSILLQESVTYLHAILFMLGAAYTLLHDGHVRLDVFYRSASVQTRTLVDLGGSLLLLIPVCLLIAWSSWPYVERSWNVLEGSKETSGIQAVFLLKSTILVFATLLLAQGLAIVARCVLVLAGADRRLGR